MKILSIISPEGGAGKSTLAAHLAVEAASLGLRVVLVDADPKQSLSAWWLSRLGSTPELVTATLDILDIIREAAYEEGVDLLVIDTPAVTADAYEIARICDLALLVVRPERLDVHALRQTVELVKSTKRPGLVAVSQAPPGRGALETTPKQEAYEAIADLGLPVARSIIHVRETYKTAMIGGRTAAELQPNGKAACEIRALLHETMKDLGFPSLGCE